MALTYRPRATVDFELLMAQMLTYDGLTVAPAVDVDSYDALPLLAFSGLNGRAIANGPYRGASEWDLSLTLWTEGFDGDLCDTVYQNVHDFDGHGVVGVGAVVSVDDSAMFTRTFGAVLPDKHVVQYDATFTVVVEPA